jgi:hypothetical protein
MWKKKSNLQLIGITNTGFQLRPVCHEASYSRPIELRYR